MAEKQKINVRLLRKVAKHITEEPNRLSMSDWIEKKTSPNEAVLLPVLVDGLKFYQGHAAVHVHSD